MSLYTEIVKKGGLYSGRHVVIPNLTHGLSVYSAVKTKLTTVQCFLDRCHKQRYISKAVNIYDLLEKRDRKIFDKRQEKLPLENVMPEIKVTEYNLRHKSSHRPKLNTDQLKCSYFNRLIFKCDLAL